MGLNCKKLSMGGAIFFALFIPAWLGFAVPFLEKIPSDFSYHADVVSYDNFYDEKKNAYLGEKRSVTNFSFEVEGKHNSTLIIKNSFDVKETTGQEIFSVVRRYGINSYTGEHVSGFGDRNRSGYLFAPRHLKKGQSFTYWHANYDGPALLAYAGEDTLFGLPVYRYETRYKGVTIDQTKNLLFLPDVGKTKGVRLEPHLQLWIEPITGYLVKYSDDTIASYYDLNSGKTLGPWNHFRNSYSIESVRTHVELAKMAKMRAIVFEWALPFVALVLVITFLLFLLRINKMLQVITMYVLTIIIFGGIILWLVFQNISENRNSESVLKKIRVGAENGLLSSAVWIAEHNGYFLDEGLDVNIVPFPSGRAAIRALLNEKTVDIATVAQTPVVLNSLVRDDFWIVAGMVNTVNDVKILARKDRDISNISDLRGKTIGITKGSTGHYFLGLLLARGGLELKDIHIVDLEATLLPEALSTGKVDAISTWEPHMYEAQKKLKGNSVLIESKGTFREDFYFTVLKDWAKNHPDSVRAFLRAIDRAETFIMENPKSAQLIVSKKLNLDAPYVMTVWKDYNFGLFLDQAILLSLEQQERWMITNKIGQDTVRPNYLDYVWLEPLMEIKPEVVSIIQ
jgi:NitT/TauT family transport system substrate-binding protein